MEQQQLQSFANSKHPGEHPQYNVFRDASGLYGCSLVLPWLHKQMDPVKAYFPTADPAKDTAARLALRSPACLDVHDTASVASSHEDSVSQLLQHCQRLEASTPSYQWSTDVNTMLWGCSVAVNVQGMHLSHSTPSIHRSKKAAKQVVANLALQEILRRFPPPTQPMDLDDLDRDQSPVSVLQYVCSLLL